MPAPRARSSTSAAPAAFRVVLALACPFVAALTVLATYLGKEVFVGALWMALGLGGLLFVQPIIGIAVMGTVYLLTAYPTLLQDLGFITINNLLGLCFGVLLVAHVLENRDLSFLRIPQIQLLVVIGVVLMIGVVHADGIFPLLQASRGRGKIIDRTDTMTHDFVTRLVFLVFMCVFVRTRRDLKVVFMVYMLSLFAAVPSALVNWLQGNLNRGFRAAASVTVGANPNKLAMICLMEVTCWWFWSRSRPGLARRAIGLGAVGASLLVLLLTGSRSGFLGILFLGFLLQTGPRGYRVSRAQIAGVVALGIVLVVTLVPPEAFQRMITMAPEKGQVGGTSNMMREETITLGARMFWEHPFLGVGLGNFREVSRQIYNDSFFRPPHNSYLWAAAEGGVLVVVLYAVFFLVTWRDLQVIMRLAPRDAELAHVASAVRIVFLLFGFFSVFADLWLTPITYLLIGMIVSMRHYLEGLPAIEVRPAARRRRLVTAAAA